MPVATSPTALAASKLRRMVSLSPSWLAGLAAALGAAPTADQAIKAVHFKDVIGVVPRPHAIISPSEQFRYKQIAGGDQNVLNSGGSVALYLAADVSPINYEDQLAAEWEALNLFDGIVDDVALLSGSDDPGSADGTSHLSIIAIQRTVFSGSPEETWQSLGRYYFAMYEFEWGD